MKPGAVFKCDFGPARGSEPDGSKRPAVVVSPSRFNSVLNTVIVIPFTTGRLVKDRKEAVCSFVPSGVGGLDEDSTAQANNIRVIDKTFLVEELKPLPEDFLDDVYAAVAEYLDLWGE